MFTKQPALENVTYSLPEATVSLGIMGTQLWAPVASLNTIECCDGLRDFRDVLNWAHVIAERR